MLPDEVREAVESTDDEFEVMLEGLSPLNRAEHIERTTFQMDRLHWQTIRAHLLAREAEVERLNAAWDSSFKQAMQNGESAQAQRTRAERAEALLRAIVSFPWFTSRAPFTTEQITAHLSENSSVRT